MNTSVHAALPLCAILVTLFAAGDLQAAPTPAAAATPPTTPAAVPATTGSAVFPGKVASKYAGQKPGEARMHTCLDQYHANKVANANGGMKWIQSGGGYYSACSKKLKG